MRQRLSPNGRRSPTRTRRIAYRGTWPGLFPKQSRRLLSKRVRPWALVSPGEILGQLEGFLDPSAVAEAIPAERGSSSIKCSVRTLQKFDSPVAETTFGHRETPAAAEQKPLQELGELAFARVLAGSVKKIRKTALAAPTSTIQARRAFAAAVFGVFSRRRCDCIRTERPCPSASPRMPIHLGDAPWAEAVT
jgi:hypothetical protein